MNDNGNEYPWAIYHYGDQNWSQFSSVRSKNVYKGEEYMALIYVLWLG